VRRDAQERPTEGDQVFGVTAIAAYPQDKSAGLPFCAGPKVARGAQHKDVPHETALQTAAFEVILEFPLDIPRQYRALCWQMGHESGVVFFDKLVKEGALRTMARVTKRAAARTGFPASRLRQHDRILASSS